MLVAAIPSNGFFANNDPVWRRVSFQVQDPPASIDDRVDLMGDLMEGLMGDWMEDRLAPLVGRCTLIHCAYSRR